MFGDNPNFFKSIFRRDTSKFVIDVWREVWYNYGDNKKGVFIMKIAVANAIREHYINAVRSLFDDEDCGMTTSNSFNFPIVWEGEEGWVEVVVKVPKYDGDEGYALREEYEMKCKERAEKAKAQAEAKAKKIERDRKAREEKKKA